MQHFHDDISFEILHCVVFSLFFQAISLRRFAARLQEKRENSHNYDFRSRAIFLRRAELFTLRAKKTDGAGPERYMETKTVLGQHGLIEVLGRVCRVYTT